MRLTDGWLPLRGRWLRYFGAACFGLLLAIVMLAPSPGHILGARQRNVAARAARARDAARRANLGPTSLAAVLPRRKRPNVYVEMSPALREQLRHWQPPGSVGESPVQAPRP